MRSSRRGRVRISREKLVAIVSALACLAFSAIGLKLYDTPSYMYVDGVRGQTVSLERAELTVSDVQVGTRLVDDLQVKAVTTGMFVMVTATLAVPGPRSVSLNRSQLITRDRVYTSWGSNSVLADPGFQQRSQLYFEVDPAHIDDLTLEIYSAAVVSGFDARARIHLGITADNADQWRQAAKGRELEYETGGTTTGMP